MGKMRKQIHNYALTTENECVEVIPCSTASMFSVCMIGNRHFNCIMQNLSFPDLNPRHGTGKWEAIEVLHSLTVLFKCGILTILHYLFFRWQQLQRSVFSMKQTSGQTWPLSSRLSSHCLIQNQQAQNLMHRTFELLSSRTKLTYLYRLIILVVYSSSWIKPVTAITWFRKLLSELGDVNNLVLEAILVLR